MPTPNGCYCNDSKLDLLIKILQQDRANFDRLGQLAQAFDPDITVGGGLASSDSCFCSSSKWDVLVQILEQRQANFDRLQQVIVAI